MLAISKFDIPGEYGFPLNSVYAKPSSSQEGGKCKKIIIIYEILKFLLLNNEI